jgi:hypothetical protein
MFGGNGADLNSSFGDTWEWDGNLWTRIQDIGASPATGAGMVFRTAVTALFGGISAINNVAGRKLFAITWEWDGHHWTARQDIGVGVRFRHAMAYDSVRARAVLFGGLTVPPDAVDADAHLQGDTWEHTDSGAGGGTQPAGSVMSVASVDAQPNPVSGGEVLTITVQLVGPAPAPGEAVDVSGDLGSLGQIQIAAGAMSGSLTIQIPPDVGNMVPLPFTGNITASASDGVAQQTTLTIQ